MKFKKETKDAAHAMVRWLDSQDIQPKEAIPILTYTICIAAISIGDGLEGDIEHINEAAKWLANTFLQLMKEARS